MKTFIWQFLVILALSLVASLSYNLLIDSSLPLFKVYIPGSSSELNDSKTYSFDEIDAETLKTLMESQNIILLDARQPLDYLKAHIPGAISLPISQFQLEYDSVKPLLNGLVIIITYCSDLTCLDSTHLATKLVENGQENVLVYRGGMKDWQQQGNPVEPSNF